MAQGFASRREIRTERSTTPQQMNEIRRRLYHKGVIWFILHVPTQLEPLAQSTYCLSRVESVFEYVRL